MTCNILRRNYNNKKLVSHCGTWVKCVFRAAKPLGKLCTVPGAGPLCQNRAEEYESPFVIHAMFACSIIFSLCRLHYCKKDI